MIFDWEKEFNEKTIYDGLDLEDNVEGITRWSDYLNGYVKEGDKSYSVKIDLDEDFKIKSMKCDCKKKKCKHMTALIFASDNLRNNYFDLIIPLIN